MTVELEEIVGRLAAEAAGGEGRLATPINSPGQTMSARSRTFRSSRTLPGHG
jgi:hypothetical protein